MRLDRYGVKSMGMDRRDEVPERVEKRLLTKLSIIIPRTICDEFRKKNRINDVQLTPTQQALQERQSQQKARLVIYCFEQGSETGGVDVCGGAWV